MSTLESQEVLCKALWTMPFFLAEIAKIFGAMSLGLIPFSQADSQNKALIPSPIRTLVAAANMSLSLSSHGFPKFTKAYLDRSKLPTTTGCEGQ